VTSLLHTLLELGHITSQNLGFAQDTHGGIKFSEETITETNLLEFRRRHPDNVHVHSFSKATESKTTGADWEWHIIGRARTLKMRVQAKRIHKAGGIGNLHQKGKKAATPQIDLLIEDAKLNGLLPIYCFYSSEARRSHWAIGKIPSKHPMMESGCLIVDAHTVLSKQPKKLRDIERDCVPWHYLCLQRQFSFARDPYLIKRQADISPIRVLEELTPIDCFIRFDNRFPTISDLTHGDAEPDLERGMYPTGDNPLTVGAPEGYRARGIARLLQIDVRSPMMFFDAVKGGERQ
jgi:hypothetical protein